MREVKKRPSPFVTPQALACTGNDLWVSSRDLGLLYRLDAADLSIREEVKPRGVVWAAAFGRAGLYCTIGEGKDDDRYVYTYTEGEGFTKRFACPDLTGSYLSFDGDDLYLSQWYKHRIVRLSDEGQIIDEIKIGAEISGHVIVDHALYLLRGTEQEGERWTIARRSLREEGAVVKDLATMPFAPRSLAFDGERFWSNHRAANEIVSFLI